MGCYWGEFSEEEKSGADFVIPLVLYISHGRMCGNIFMANINHLYLVVS